MKKENLNIVSHNTMESIFSNFVHLNDKSFFSMGNGEVYGRFVLILCVYDFDCFSILYFCFPIGNSHCFLITQGVIKNIILSCFNLCD